MVYAQPRILPEEWGAQNSLGFWSTNGWPNLGQTTRPSYSQQQQKKKKEKRKRKEKDNIPNCGLWGPGRP